MEGVGARLGRSSTRYGPATVFTGPVRKWKKTWVHVSSSNSNSNAAAAAAAAAAPAANGNNSAHLLLYKWTPISQNANNNSNSNKDDDAAAAATTEEEPPRRKFRYVPVAVLEEQRNEASARDDDEVNGDSLVADASQTTLKGDRNVDRKPDVNDVPMEEVQTSIMDQETSEGPGETNLDLNLA